MEEYIEDNCNVALNEEVIHWDQEKPVEFTLADTKCFKTPSGIQKTATIGVKTDNLLESNYLDNVLETNDDLEEFHDSSNIPSTSTCDSRQPVPLRRLSIKIGEKVLKFKVINAEEAPENPEPFEPIWVAQPTPVSEPKPLAGFYHCANCKTYFGNKLVWQNHMTDVHGDPRPYRCFSCGMRFANKSSLTIHLKEHTVVRPNFYSCKSCPKTFVSSENLDKHSKLHEARLECRMCNKFFSSSDQLASHENQCHSSEVRYNEDLLPNGQTARFSCGFCSKRFHFKRDMVIHERIHTGEKPFTCGYCGRGFAQSQALTIHIRMHTQEFPYKCNSCPKKFRDTSSLRKHEMSNHMNTQINMPMYRICSRQTVPKNNK